MDAIVAQAMAKWPNVPAVYGWLSLDRRGNWRIKGERIANHALRDFISRNYESDAEGRWYFQNGPQRVYVALDYTPLVVHYEGDELRDHRGRPFATRETYLDDEGSVLMEGEGTLALLDDRDLARFAESASSLQRIKTSEIQGRFGFVKEPKPT
ncbi:MAG: DUF2946 family protein [Betaproteobacteria bacterium]|nr:DUF2946 family protein [Betaproteobacteria bacterium]MBV9361476.1 DUF2946 family protein [Betaproteobacteria bacterium]